MRITWLLEDASQIWGGVKVALEDANWLHRRGHEVTVLSRSGPPAWMQLECAFQQVADFHPEHLPDADVIVGTFWTTVPWAASAGPQKGVAVHYCQGYEGNARENEALRDRIEAAYRLPGVHHITISSNLTKLLRDQFDIEAVQIIYTIDEKVHHPGPERAANSPLRVGIVGPYQISWKDLPTGYEACKLANAAGQSLTLVRATNTEPAALEMQTPFEVEWHQKVPPGEMGDFYRSLDVFVATSSGAEEGFFLPAIEAMACGVPTVLTDIPCFRSHGKDDEDYGYALFVPPSDPAAMAEAIVVAGRVPNVRAGLRQEGLKLASRYTQDPHGVELEAALQNLVSAETTSSQLQIVQPTTVSSNDSATAASTAAKLARARAILESGDPSTALVACDALGTDGCDDEALHVVRGTALHALQRFDDAAQAFRAAIAVGPRTADAMNRLGMVLFQAGDIRGARQSFESAIALSPTHDDARANLSALPAA